MKNNPLVTILLGLLTLSVLASLGFCWQWMSSERERRELMREMGMINNNRNVISALANDTVEYSKKHPEIDPILVSVGLKPGSNAVAAPATKPATK
jgi:hypothetical protein